MKKNFTQLIAQSSSLKRYTIAVTTMLLLMVSAVYLRAAVGITITGSAFYNISADDAASNTFTNITNIEVSEGLNNSDDFASRNTYSIVLTAPTGWAFPTTNSIPNIAASLGNGGEVTLNTTPIFSTDGSTLIFNLSAGNGAQNKRDIITIANLRVRPTTGVISSPQPRAINVQVINTTNTTPTNVVSSSPISLQLVPGAPNKLAFLQQPTTVEINTAITPTPSVVIQDRFGNVVTTATNTVSLTRVANPSLSGTLTPGTASIANGVVTFTGASINTAGAGYQLVASSSGLTSVTSTSFTVNNPRPVVTEVVECLTVGDPQTTVTIRGENFVSGASVTFGGVAATSVTVNNATTITAVLPAAAFATAGDKNVIVTNPTPASNNGVSLAFVKKVIQLFSFPIEGANAVCANTPNSPAFSVQTGPNVSSYLWTVVSGDASIASGGTTGNPRINFGAPGQVVLSVIQYNVCGKPGPAVTRTITVNARPDVILSASKTAICSGESVELSASGAESYVWTGGGLPAGTTGDKINVSPTATTTTTTYTYTLTGSNIYSSGTGTLSCPTIKTVTITVTPALSQGAITGNTQLCQNGATTTLTGTVSGGVSSKTYLWEQSANAAGPWDPAAGTNNLQSYNPSTADAGTMYYRRTVTSGSCTITSDAVAVTVTPAIENNTIATPNQNICSENGIALLDGATATAGGLQITYLWEQSATGTGNWTAAIGANGNTAEDFQPDTRTVTSASTIYYRRTASAGNCTNSSSVVSVTVNPLPAATITQGAFTYFCSPGTALLSATSIAGASYTWFRVESSGDVEVANTRTTNVGVVGTYYVVVKYDATGCESTSATISVQETVVGNNIVGVNNGNQEVCYNTIPQEIEGSTATSSVGPVRYQWEVSTDNVTFTDLTDATGINLTRAQLGAHTADRWYRRKAIVGSCTNLSAETVHISVKPELLLTSGSGTTVVDAICSGTAFTYTPTSNAPANSTYSWSRADVAGISTPASSGTGAIDEVLTNTTPNPLEVTYVYRITTPENCESAQQFVKVAVNPRPVLSNSTTQVAVCSNTPFTYTATTATTNLPAPTFTWTRAAVPGISNAAVTNGTGATVNETLVNTTTAPIDVTYTYKVTAYGCEGPEQNVVVTVNPTPTVNAVANRTHCNGAAGAAISFGGGVSGTTYSWSSTANVGFGTGGTDVTGIPAYTATNATNAPVTATVTVTPKANGCAGTPATFTVRVDPTPTVNAVANRTHCNGAAGAAISFGGGVSGTTYSWSSTANVGFGTGGTDVTGIPAYTATNATNAPVTATVTVTPKANGCAGTPATFTVRVDPTPTVNAVANRTHCNGAAGAAISFGGGVSGTTYSWSSTANVGFGTGGTDVTGIPAYTATNATNAPVTATVTVTPKANGCAGTPATFTVRVDPTPTVNAVANRTHCNGAAGAAISFGGGVSGTTYSWSSTANVGFGTGGTDVTGIPAYTATNATNAPVTATVTVTPKANGCAGTPATFTVRVDPTPTATFSGVENGQVVYSGAGNLTLTPTGTTGGTFSIVSPSGTTGLSGSTLNLCTALGTATEKDITIRYTVSIGTAPNNCSATEQKTFKIKRSTYRAVITADPHPFCRGVQVTYTTTIYRDLEEGDVIYPYLVDTDGQPIDGSGNPIPTGSSSFPVPNKKPVSQGGYPFPDNTPESVKDLAYRFFQPVVKSGLESKVVNRDAATYQWGKNHEVNRKNDRYFTTDAGLSSQDYYHVYVNLDQCGTVIPLQSNRMYSAELPGYSATLTATPNPICSGGSVTFTASLNTAFDWLTAKTKVEFILARGDVPLGIAQDFVKDKYTYTLTTDASVAGGFVNGDQVYLKFITDIENAQTVKKCADNNRSNNVTINVVVPQAFTGGGAFCEGSGGVPIGLSSSQTNVSYQLLRDGAPVGTAISGTGGSISFGSQTIPGTYSIRPTTSSGSTCTTFGTINVYETKLPLLATVSGGGGYCAGGTGVPIKISNTQTTVSYQLRRTVGSTTTNVGSPIVGNGGDITFPSQTLEGTYTVRATTLSGTNIANCPRDMSGSATVSINALPTVTAPNVAVCEVGSVEVKANASSGTGPYTYSWQVPSTWRGANGATNPGNVASFMTSVPGNYTVTVSDSKSCSSTSATSTVTVTPLDKTFTEPILQVVQNNYSTSREWVLKAVEDPAFTSLKFVGLNPTYRWYKRLAPSTDWGSPIPGATADTLTEKNPQTGLEFKVEITVPSSCRVFNLTNIGVTPLPVEIIYLTAEKQGNDVVLEWATAMEKDNAGFEIQVSQNGRDYRKLDYVATKNGNASQKQIYKYVDKENGKYGTRYYRLKQTDVTGEFEYFGPKVVEFGSMNNKIVVYPNPFKDKVEMNIEAEADGVMEVILSNSIGKQLIQKTIMVEKGLNTEQLLLESNLPRGVYFVTTRMGGVTSHFKLLKQ